MPTVKLDADGVVTEAKLSFAALTASMEAAKVVPVTNSVADSTVGAMALEPPSTVVVNVTVIVDRRPVAELSEAPMR